MKFLKFNRLFTVVLASSVLLSIQLANAESGTQERRQLTQLPFRLVNGSMILVRGSIGNQTGLNIVLDTGTNPTIVSTQVAAKFNVRGVKEESVALGGTFQAQSVNLPEIDIAAWHVDSPKAVVRNLDFLKNAYGVRIDAIAGIDILRSHSWMVNFDKRKIVFDSAPHSKNTVRFVTRRPCLTVRLAMSGQQLLVMVDSGTPRLLLFKWHLNAGLASLKAVDSQRGPAIKGAANATQAKWYRASRVVLGTRNLGPQTVLLVSANSGIDSAFDGRLDGLLGISQMGFHKVWFDFEDGLLAWE